MSATKMKNRKTKFCSEANPRALEKNPTTWGKMPIIKTIMVRITQKSVSSMRIFERLTFRNMNNATAMAEMSNIMRRAADMWLPI